MSKLEIFLNFYFKITLIIVTFTIYHGAYILILFYDGSLGMSVITAVYYVAVVMLTVLLYLTIISPLFRRLLRSIIKQDEQPDELFFAV